MRTRIGTSVLTLALSLGNKQDAVQYCEARGVPVLMTVPLHPRFGNLYLRHVTTFEGPWTGMDPYQGTPTIPLLKPPTRYDRWLFELHGTALHHFYRTMLAANRLFVTHYAGQVEQGHCTARVEVNPRMFNRADSQNSHPCLPKDVIGWAQRQYDHTGYQPLLLDTRHLAEFGAVFDNDLEALSTLATPTLHFQTLPDPAAVTRLLSGKATGSLSYLTHILRYWAMQNVQEATIIIEQTPLHRGLCRALWHPRSLTARGAARFQVQVAEVLQHHIDRLNL